MVGAMPVNLIPKFCNGTMDSRNTTDNNEIQVNIGSRVKSGDDFGTVKYIGEVQGYKGVWYGVEWDNATRGKHNGSVDNVQYFKTAKPDAGSFVRPNKIFPFNSCAQAIRKYYGDREDETVAAHRRTVINEWKREMGAPFIEMVGFEKIHQKQKLDRLREVCVHDQCISRGGDIATLCPNVKSLDLSANLFSNWREIIQIGAQLPDLNELDVSKNRIAIDMTEETLAELSHNFANLEKLNISICDYDWQQIVSLSYLWPNINEIIAAHNRIQIITPPLNMNHLTILRLDGNPIDSWMEVGKLGKIKNLRVLSLNDCYITDIRFNEEATNKKVDVFQNLEILFLNRNNINDWRSVSELDKLSRLKKLYFLKNPVQNNDDYDTGSQLIVAKIGTLTELNGSTITREHRRGAEYDYMKRYGAEYKLTRSNGNSRVFDIEHCRFQELIDKYGIPEDSLLQKQIKNSTLTSQLLEITMTDEKGNKIVKKFPSTMQVLKMVTLAQRLFSKFGNTGKPSLYIVDDMMNGAEICLDNHMKELSYFSLKNGDNVIVRFR